MDTDAPPEAGDDGEPLPARIDSVRVAGTPNGPVPVVCLAVEVDGVDSAGGADGPLDPDGEVLPIFIGFEEARSIVRGMEAEDIGRPLTHDLTLDIVEELGGRVTRVVVSRLEAGTFFADLRLATPRDDVTVDARPSDSLALAARTNAPLAVARTVWDEGAEDAEQFVDLQDVREVLRDDE
jgi:bifunctional DNase/RNase